MHSAFRKKIKNNLNLNGNMIPGIIPKACRNILVIYQYKVIDLLKFTYISIL